MSEFSKLADKKKTICMSDHEQNESGDWVPVSDLRGKATTFVDDYDPVFLARGDIVRLTSGQNVPADIRIISAQKFKVDNSPLTGEPDALPRNEKECFHDDPKESTNLVFYGTNVKEGEAIGVVLRVGDDTFIGKIAALTEDTATEKTPIAKEIDHFVMIVSGVAIFLGVVFFFIGVGLGTDLITNLVFVIGIIVANVPEGLLATVTVALTLTSRAMAAKNVLVKNMEGVETLGSTTCICSDKTGTLTQNRMTCAELLYDNEIHRTPFVDVSPGESTPAADLSAPTFAIFHEAMCMNTTATFKPSQVRGIRNKATKQIDPATRVPFYSIRKGEHVPVVQWDTVGDASETSIVKLAQYTHPEAYRESPLDTKQGILNRHNQDLVDARRQDYPLEDKIPFNSTNKYHVVIRKFPGNDPNRRFTIYMKGAPERILVRCDSFVMNGEVQRMSQSVRTRIESLQKTLMRKGRRVLAFAYQFIGDDILPPAREVTVEKKDDAGNVIGSQTKTMYFDTQNINFPMGEYRREVDGQIIEPPTEASKKPLVFIGMTALIDPPRPSVPDAVKSCLEAGIRVVMVTGDHPETAAAIARMVNIFTSDFKFMAPLSETGKDPLREKFTSRGIVVAGSQFSPDTTDEKWKFIFSHEEIVFARTSPQQKLQIVQRFQQMEREIVAVTGDGVNDAPALKKADIGVAMGIAGTDVSKTAADMILMDDNFASIVRGVEEGRLIFDNLKKSIAYTLSSNIPEIGPFLVFITVQVPLPLSTVLILCIDLGTDMVPAISMAWENPESDIMKRPPRDSSTDRLVTKKLVSFAYLQIGIIQAIAGFFTWIVVMNDYGYPPHILPGLGSFDNWGKQVLWCQVEGGVMRDIAGNAGPSLQFQSLALEGRYIFWDELEDGIVQQCMYAVKNLRGSNTDADYRDYLVESYPNDFTGGTEVVTDNSIQALVDAGYIPFIPWKAYQSPFWENKWLAYDILDSGIPGAGEDVDPTLFFNVQNPGLWTPDFNAVDADRNAAATGDAELLLGSDNMYTRGTFSLPPKNGDWVFDPTFQMFKPGSSDVPAEDIERYQLMFAGFHNGALRMNVAVRDLSSFAIRPFLSVVFLVVSEPHVPEGSTPPCSELLLRFHRYCSVG